MPNISSLTNKKLLFDSQTTWCLSQYNHQIIFLQKTPVESFSNPFLAAYFNSDYQQCKLYTHSNESESSKTDPFYLHPLDFPLGQILMISLLAQKRGIMFHACGIDDGGCGYLFIGNSTYGKSTLARLWQKEGQILNDDRIIVRQKNGRFWMYGTPWHGDFPELSPRCLPVNKIFFINHADANNMTKLRPIKAASKLISCCFPVIWDKQGIQFTIDICAQLSSAIPCYKLDFKPDQSIIDFVRCDESI